MPRFGVRDFAISEEIVELARFLWHQEDDRRKPLFSSSEVAKTVEISYGTLSGMAFRKGFRKRAGAGSSPAWAERSVVSNREKTRDTLRNAAPDLLAALERYVAAEDSHLTDTVVDDWAKQGSPTGITIQMARQAIRKAKGL